jgi:transcriptional regulator
MYLPAAYEERRPEVLRALVDAHGFATLVLADAHGLEVNHLPMLLDPARGRHGALRGHVSRANPVVHRAPAATSAVAIFGGPEGYVSPSWYPSKAETHRVVPTWNYAVVHAHGTLRLHDDVEWLRAHVDALTRRHEGGREPEWRVEETDPGYREAQLRGIVGLELAIERIEGKWKLGQNRSEADRRGMLAGLEQQGDAASRALAALVRGSLGD